MSNKLKKIHHGSDAGNASIKSPRHFALAFEAIPSCPIVAKWLDQNIADAPEKEQLNLQVNTLAQQFRDMLYQLYRLKKAGLSFEERFDQKSIKNRWGKMVDSFGAPAGELIFTHKFAGVRGHLGDVHRPGSSAFPRTFG